MFDHVQYVYVVKVDLLLFFIPLKISLGHLLNFKVLFDYDLSRLVKASNFFVDIYFALWKFVLEAGKLATTVMHR